MKKILIPLLLLLFVGLGCSKKSEPALSDSLQPAVVAGVPGHALYAAPTTKIMPANAQNTTDMTLTMLSGGRTATVSCYFVGEPAQQVTVSYSVSGSAVADTLRETKPMQWTSIPNSIPNNATSVTVKAGSQTVPYTHSESYPIAAGGTNTYGIAISKYYNDGQQDTVYVVVQDAALTSP